ncbi:Holliday junction branch migration DNA helicase RuvB [Mycoplasmopsis ciconiae]|uniref:Holliday junction branch migration complex subunit RuvB n=1 Tax=Mycoplasmopsis ciconiae TaxID=561067 RepID=A0ABU7MLT4_9BACT|nr:Holliday junction branch migration DNA helicase RuvB [Mycoplasmopsis ciconiae]
MKKDFKLNNFSEFIGQKKLLTTLKAMIKSAKIQNKNIDHILFSGVPGSGKTTLATLIAKESNRKIHYIQAISLEKKADLISILSVINENDILFIDEIHSLNKTIEELLYSAMEYFVFDLVVGVDQNAKTIRMKLKKFTLIGATTLINNIAKPLLDRFGYVARLEIYEESDILKIITNTAKKLNISAEENALEIISKHSQCTPRIANNLLKRCYDFCVSDNKSVLSKNTVLKTLKYLDIYEYGLTKQQIDYINLLRESFNEKWVSLNTISSITKQHKEIILNEIEPLLLLHGLIEKGGRGRRISTQGIDYLIKNVKLNIS